MPFSDATTFSKSMWPPSMPSGRKSRYTMGMESVAGAADARSVQMKPGSTVQAALQPSPERVFPSSQASCGARTPSPHTGRQTPSVQRGSAWQFVSQPSPRSWLPSSHCSAPSMS